MSRSRQFVATALIAAFTIATIGTGFSVSAQQGSYRSGDQQVRQLLFRIEQRSTQFRQNLYDELDQTWFDDSRQVDNINEFVRTFETATATLRDRFRQGRDVAVEVREVMNRAAFIDRFMGRHRFNSTVEQQWLELRSDLDSLARYSNVAWNWQDTTGRPDWQGRPDGRGRYASLLTGTYRVDPARSDRVGRAARIATRGLSVEDQQRMRDLISRRLEAPEMLAIDRQGRTVTIASTRGPQLTIEADGRERVDQTPNGRTIRVNALLTGDRLTITTTGNRGNDYNVTFESLNNGRELRVTRRMETDSLDAPVTVISYYTKSSDVAQLDLYREDTSVGTGRDGSRLPDSTQLIATLDNNLSTRQARSGDRFTLTVQSPPEFRGAVIEGYLGRVERSGRVQGRPEVAMNFERIRLPGGDTRKFDGYIESVRTSNGDDVRVDSEGVVAEQDSQTTRTATRTGIGAALGALIGAVAGGGKGAAIGAAVGAGAGAGSIFVQGRDDLELISGSEFTIRAIMPRYGARPGD